MIGAGGLAIAWSVWSIATEGWLHWWREYRALLTVHVTLLGLGVVFVRAARTGHDPYVSDTDDDTDESDSHRPSA